MTQDSRLSFELEVALIDALSREWDQINRAGKMAMRRPTISLSDAATKLGCWIESYRTIEISRTLILDTEWGAVVEVLKHEMAHQYVHEKLNIHDETAHGTAFRDVCKSLAIDASASGLPGENGRTVADSDARILRQVAKLLALGGSSNQHEAESAMSEAQRLMLKHNLEAAPATPASGYEFRHLGRPTGRISESHYRLSSILSEHFFVEAIWAWVWQPLEGKGGRVLEICGTKTNLAMACYVYDFLVQTSERLWREHKRSQNVRSNRDRRSYLAGVMTGFRDKLERERVRQSEQGLIWIGDSNLRRYFRKRNPNTTSARAASSAHNEAHAHGRQAGRNIVLHRPLENCSARGHLLTGRSGL